MVSIAALRSIRIDRRRATTASNKSLEIFTSAVSTLWKALI